MTCLFQRIRLVRPISWLYVMVAVPMLGACTGSISRDDPGPAFIPDTGYYLLMAEIAVQRKAWLTAAEQYLNAAEQSSDPELARRAAEFALEYGYETFALSGVRRWLDLEPDNRAAHEYAGRLYLRRYDTERAFTHLSALPGEPPDEEVFLALSVDLANEGNAAGVTAVFKRFARHHPDSSALQLALARTAMSSGDYELALLAARKAGSQDSNLLDSQLLVAQALMALGHEVAALEQVRSLRSEPASIAVEMEYISLLAGSERVAQANDQLAELVRIYGGQADFLRVHALINLAGGDLDTAEQDFNKLLAAGQNIYECFFYLGRIAVTRGEYRRSIDYFSRVRGGSLLLPAKTAEVLAYQKLDEGQVGLDKLQAFALDHPRLALAVLPTRAQLLFALGETQQALATFDELLGYQPDAVDILLEYGTMLDLSDELRQSLVVMRRAAELAPMDANVLNTLGYTLANRTRHSAQAYRLIRHAYELDPDSPAIIDSMGWALYQLGRDEEALSYLEQAHGLLADPEVIAHLGELLWATGEPERARALIDSSLDEYPDHELLVETRARLSP